MRVKEIDILYELANFDIYAIYTTFTLINFWKMDNQFFTARILFFLRDDEI